MFACTSCRRPSLSWFSICRECGRADTCAVTARTAADPQAAIKVSREVVTLQQVEPDTENRLVSGIAGFDDVTGGGVVIGSAAVLCGAPGQGKSTLALQVAAAVSKKRTTLYIAGEETPARLSARALRLRLDNSNILVCSHNEISSLRRVFNNERPALVIVDSLQSLYSSRLKSRTGSPSQLVSSTNFLVRSAQNFDCAIIIVAHMTKDGSLASPRTVEHDIDVMLYFEQDEKEGDKRLLYASKNRFGPAYVPAVFRMTARGLVDVDPEE